MGVVADLLLETKLMASWCSKQGAGGIGWIIRDSVGSLINAGYKKIKREWSIEVPESQATIVESLKAFLILKKV